MLCVNTYAKPPSLFFCFHDQCCGYASRVTEATLPVSLAGAGIVASVTGSGKGHYIGSGGHGKGRFKPLNTLDNTRQYQ